MKKVIANTKLVRNAFYMFEARERVGGKIYYTKAIFKYASDPFRVYMYQLEPEKGIELLYVKGENGGNLSVNPAGFPWTTLNVNPEGSVAMRNRHHPITHAGFGYS
ncbi:MAG TPA: DUF1571 domain-containing protein, partial [Spirochaetota bacterium]